MTEKEIGYFQIFQEVARAVLSVLSVKEVLHLISKRIVVALNAKASALMLINKETGVLEIMASHLLSKEYLSKGPLDPQKSISETLKGGPVLVEDASTDERIQYKEMASKEGIATILSVPMTIRGAIAGVLRIYTAQPRTFTDNELELISAMAEIGAIAIENAHVFEYKEAELSQLLERSGVDYDYQAPTEKYRIKAVSKGEISPDKSYRYFKELHDLTRTIAADMEAEKIIENVVKEIALAMEVKGCSLLWLNSLTRELELIATYGLSQTYLDKGPLKVDRSIPQALEGEVIFIDNVQEDPRIQYPEAAQGEGIVSILSVPILVKEKVRGVLRLYSSQSTPFAQEEIEFVKAAAEIGGIAILNAKLYQAKDHDISFWMSTLDYLGITDPPKSHSN
jgi:GAF domain-containing protein